MAIRCPFCKHHVPLYRLRTRFVCLHCSNPLRARLVAPTLTFLFLFVASDGFLALVWWALALPPPASAQSETSVADAAAAAAAAAMAVAPGTSPTAPPAAEAVHWFNDTAYLIILGCFISWALFVWIFGNITQVALDVERLPGHRPHRRHVRGHYHGEESSAK